MNGVSKPPTGGLWDYLRLMRVSNLFTAVADVAMGYFLVRPDVTPVGGFVLVVAASCLLYSAGMVLNDVFDIARDRRERPERPIPSGRIAWTTARRLGWSLWIGGLMCGWAAGYWPPSPPLAWRSGVVALGLALGIVLYNGVLKATAAGPLMMGTCRFFNVLLGASLGLPFMGPHLMGFGPHHVNAALGIGLYITGVTYFARHEAGISRRAALAAAVGLMVLGITVLGWVHRTITEFGAVELTLSEPFWWLLLAMLAMTIVRRCLVAVVRPEPLQVQLAVRHALWSLIMLDAAVVLLVRDLYSLGIVALLIPTMILGKWVAST